ncbi:MAG: hypothetical protein AB7Q00_03470 [Phycisphaerales bacterium]
MITAGTIQNAAASLLEDDPDYLGNWEFLIYGVPLDRVIRLGIQLEQDGITHGTLLTEASGDFHQVDVRLSLSYSYLQSYGSDVGPMLTLGCGQGSVLKRDGTLSPDIETLALLLGCLRDTYGASAIVLTFEGGEHTTETWREGRTFRTLCGTVPC